MEGSLWADLESLIEHGDLEAVRSMLATEADINARNSAGETLLFVASKNGNVQLLRVLKGLGADINARSNQGWTPVHIASLKGHAGTLRMLAQTLVVCVRLFVVGRE